MIFVFSDGKTEREVIAMRQIHPMKKMILVALLFLVTGCAVYAPAPYYYGYPYGYYGYRYYPYYGYGYYPYYGYRYYPY